MSRLARKIPASAPDPASAVTTPDNSAALAAALTGQTHTRLDMDARRLTATLLAHGVDGLAAAAPCNWPGDMSRQLRRQAMSLQFWEDQHKTCLAAVLKAFDDAAIPAVLIKGTACAYSVYDKPWTRTRGDSDLLIAPDDRDRAMAVLTDLGFSRSLSFSDVIAVRQASFEKSEPGPGFSHVIDLHWALSNSAVLSRCFDVAAILSRAVPLPRLSPQAQAPDPADGLLITCMHRYVHRVSPYSIGARQIYSSDRLIWLMDIHLLANSLSDSAWTGFAHRAQASGLGATCASGLAAAQSLLDTSVPAAVLAELSQPAPMSPAQKYLIASQSGRLLRDAAAQPGLAGTAAFLRAHAFPPAAYMRARFSDRPADPLAVLYLRRGWRGLTRLLRPSNAG